jgi:hypothetical protein
MAEFLEATDVDRIPPSVSRQVFLYGKIGRLFLRDSALNWKILSIRIMKQSRAIPRSGYNFESIGYDRWVSQAGLLGDI